MSEESINMFNANNGEPTTPELQKMSCDVSTICASDGDLTESNKIRNPIIQPRWGSGADLPEQHVIDCADLDMKTLDEDLVKKAQQMFKENGVVMFKNTGLDSTPDMEQWALAILDGKMKYEGGSNSRRSIKEEGQEVAKNVYDTGAPSSAHLHYHHEMAYIPKSVEKIGFCCIKNTNPSKGWTWVTDEKAHTKWILSTKFGQNLKEKGVCYVRCLTNKKAYEGGEKTWNGIDEIGVYNHWQQSFGVETREECEEKLKALGPQFQWTWGAKDYLVTRFYVDAYEKLNEDGLNYLYASVADDSIWFDAWHGVSHLPTMDEPAQATAFQRPLKLTFGDMTEFSREELMEFVEGYDKFGYPIKWEKGDIAIICNYRWAHGRPEYFLEEGEERELGVILGPQYDRQGQIGEWPEPDANA